MRFASIALAATAVVACKKTPAPKPPAPAVPMPTEVFAVVTLPTIDASVPRLATYIDQISPGDGAEMRAELDAELKPRAIDGSRPIYFVVMVPPAGSDEPDGVVVAATRDPAATSKQLDGDEIVRVAGEWAVIGNARSVDRAFAWATTALVATPAPKRATAVLYAAPARARWAAELRAQLDDDGDTPPPLRDLVLGLVEQTEKVEAFADFKDDDLVLELMLTPRAGTTLENVLAAQKPSTFALFERLPMAQPLGAMAGHLALGELARPAEDLLIAAITSELGDSAPDLGQRVNALVEALFDVGTGEYAGVTIIAANSVINTFGVTDAARVGVAIDRVADALRALPLPPGLQLDLARSTHAGVAMTVATLFAGKAPVASGAWATWKDTLAFSLTDPEGALLRETIDNTRKSHALPPDVARALADARTRGDSLVTIFDVLPGDEHPLVFSLGVRTTSAYVWMRVSAAQAAALSNFRDGDGDEPADDD
ncbi:MAG TPA: hypothetical protein VM261_24275 [Kofleriaceae bacterium]|nr:hypothetical protein [Kofleriaceae bacterium]